VGEEALGRGAPELLLFEPEIAPWRPADSVAVTLVMALQLTAHHEEEVCARAPPLRWAIPTG
jgi:penicillin amidase